MISMTQTYRPFCGQREGREALLAALPLADIVKVSEGEMNR